MIRRIPGLLALVPLFTFLGCASNEPNVRPPKEAMAFRTAPDEPAYNRPMEYPKESMEQDPLIKKAKGIGLPGMTQKGGQQGGMLRNGPNAGGTGF